MKSHRFSPAFIALFLSMLIIFITSCIKDSELEIDEPDIPESDILKLDIPSDFDYETASVFEVNIETFKSTQSGNTKYEIYLYDSKGKTINVTTQGDDGNATDQTGILVDILNNLNHTRVTDDPNFSVNLTLPNYCDSLFIVKNEMGHYSTATLPLTSQKATATFSEEIIRHKSTRDDPTDMLYGVNSLRDVFTVNPLTGERTMVTTMPSTSGGSWACAIDPIEEIFYTVGINYPYRLYAYDINEDSWSTQGSTYYQGPRLGYNINDGMLYYSFNQWVLLINPDNGNMISYYELIGLHELDGGDLVFAENGRMYISCTSGLYKCDFGGGNKIYATRISSDNLPNYPNSLTFDNNQELWWASNVGYDGRIFIMDTTTGGWEDRYTLTNKYIHDLATLPLDETQIEEQDSDDDGIIDFYDEYPDDPDRAYDTYTPSIYGWGTYAFEDLWPNQGDYDFNDLVINYRFTNVLNADDKAVETYWDFKIKNIGGSLKDGFGIEIDMDKSLIDQVTGYNLTESMINLAANGLENGQGKAVIIVFDNAWKNEVAVEFRLVITYSTPQFESDIMNYNPFMFVDLDRGREVHMSNFPPTDLANYNYFGTADDTSDPTNGRYYKNVTNLPWGINIIHDFVYPIEKHAINLGYTKFASWAESGGSEYADWYKDQYDYRNYSHLVSD